jgi:hypothetical protein
MPPTTTTLTTDYRWHPVVHHAEYEETLYFLLIRLAEARHRPVAEQIRRVLGDADVHFACEYSVFGYWDVLVRVWLNGNSYHRLARLLKRTELSNVAKFETFETTELRYLWSGRSENLLDEDQPKLLKMLTRREKDVRRAVDNPDQFDSAAWRKFEEDGLVIDHRPAKVAEDGNNVKFYIVLERVGGDIPPEDEQDKVLSAITTCEMTDRSSLYTGNGRFASYLVRCVAESYSDVLHFSASLDIELTGTRLRPMTLLIANTDARESDWVNHPQPLPRRVEHTLNLLALEDGPAKFPNLTTRDWDALYELVQHAHELAGEDGVLLLKLLDILRACLKDDHDELARALAFVSDSEWFFSKYMQRVWALTIGDHWLNELKKQFAADSSLSRSSEAIKKDKAKWTIGNYAYFAVATATFNKVFDARLRRELIPDWKTQVIRYAELRNEPAHGKLRETEHVDAFRLNSLRSLLLELMDVAALCSRCRHAVEAEA